MKQSRMDNRKTQATLRKRNRIKTKQNRMNTGNTGYMTQNEKKKHTEN